MSKLISWKKPSLLAVILLIAMAAIAVPASTIDAQGTIPFTGIVGSTTTDPAATSATWYLRHVGNPVPSCYRHSYQWASPAITCDPNNTAVTFTGTITANAMAIGDVSFVGLLDKGLLGCGYTGYQSGAYAYIYKISASTVRIGPTDGNLSGEIIQVFRDYTIPAGGVLNLAMTIYNGTISISIDSDTPLTDTYGAVKVLNNTAANGFYTRAEFLYGAVPGWDSYSATNNNMPYNLSLTGCQIALSPSTINLSANPSTLTPTGTSQITAFYTDGAGTGIDGQTVNFSILSGPGTLSAASAVTAGGGYASVDLTGDGTIAITSVRASLASPSCGCADTTVAFAAPPPVITGVSPARGLQGQCPVIVIITGTNLEGATSISFGTGITVTSFTVNSETQITANICINRDADPGTRDVSVITIGGSDTKNRGFTVDSLRKWMDENETLSGSSGGAIGTYGYSPPVALPAIIIQSASLSAKSVTPGTPVTVTADIANKSAVNGNKKITLYVNGQVENSQAVTVNSGGFSQLTFNISRSDPGEYSVYVDGTPAGSFKVELFRESDVMLILSATLIALAFLIGIVILWRRQRAG